MQLTTSAMLILSALYGVPQSVNNGTTTIPVAIEATATTNIENYTRTYFKDTPILAEVAKCESRFIHFEKNGNVIRGKINKADVGVMQINEFYHLDVAKSVGINIYTLEGNLEYGKLLYEKYGTKPWGASKACWGKFVA